MTPGWIRLALAAFAALSGAFVINIFLLQPAGVGSRENVIGAAPSPGIGNRAPAAAWSLQLASRGETQAINAGLEPASGGDSIELTRAVQRELKAKGYETGAVDGVAGLVTRAAIMAYEADHGLALTAEPRQALLQHIILGAAMGGQGSAPQGSAGPGPEAQAVVRTVQGSLAKLGFAPGAADGRLSDETIRAIRKFETAQGMKETGRISGPLAAKLAGLAGSS
jgi:peptidoglycan hydrolase-like protein with peptidoglycan-binding domain